MSTPPRSPVHDPQCFAINGAAYDVHREFGDGFSEAIHRHALTVELKRRNIPFARDVRYPVSYKGELLPVHYIADIVCYGAVIVELKVIPAITGREYAQLRNYLRVSGLTRGMILNFGGSSLDSRRVECR